MSVPKYVMHVKNLFAGYGETEILHGVDINIGDGEIVCILMKQLGLQLHL